VPNTPRMDWPYPSRNKSEWFTQFEGFAQAQDASGYAAREDRNLKITGGGPLTFAASAGLLTRSSDIVVPSPITGFTWTIASGSLNLDDGEFAYLTLPRRPLTNRTVSLSAAATVPSTDDDWVVAVRVGDRVYFREGQVLRDGESKELLQAGGGGVAVGEPTDASDPVPLSYLESHTLRKERITGYHQVDGVTGALNTQDFIPFDPTLYPDAQIDFVASLWVSVGTINVAVEMYNVSDGETLSSSQISGVSDLLPTIYRATLTQGDSAGEMKLSEKLYEVRLSNDGSLGSELVNLGGAYLEISYP